MSKTEILLIGVVLLIGLFFIGNKPTPFGSAPSGLESTVATSSSIVVGTSNVVTIFATTTNCASRIVTTAAEPITLQFSDAFGLSPSTTTGHWQATSSTVVYDAGLYGCNAFKAHGLHASSTITITETR